jgi:hypothetical protein
MKRFHPDLHPDGRRRRAPVNGRGELSSRARRAEYDAGHPTAGTPGSGHWAASRRPIRPSQPTTTVGDLACTDARRRPRTIRQPGDPPPTRRPTPLETGPRTFRDSGWAALIVAAVFLALLVIAVVVGKLA